MIDESVLPLLDKALLAAAEQGQPLLTLDLQGTEFFSSSFIELLFRIWNRIKAREGRFAICNLHPYCRQVLEITNLHRIWLLVGSRADAVHALKQDKHDPATAATPASTST